MRLRNKVAVITGAGAGIGRAGALLFAREGSAVVVCDIDAARAQAVADQIRNTQGRAIAFQADVAVEGDVSAVVVAAVEHFGRLDVMWNNAGVPPIGAGTVPVEETTYESWRRVIDVNISGVFYGIKHAVRSMKESGGGSIVVTSSSGAFQTFPGFGIYSAAKAGANGLVRHLANEVASHNIRINAICPTTFGPTNFLRPPGAPVVTDQEREAAVANTPTDGIPLSRFATLDEIAEAALFFASDKSGFITGQALLIDSALSTLAYLPSYTSDAITAHRERLESGRG